MFGSEKKPPFAITNDALLDERHDTYQSFMNKKQADCIVLLGVRASESVQRLYNFANRQSQEKIFPIYDWTDTDVWNYIRENNLEFPDAYKYMYQVGVPLSRLRISQFFSVDTATSLVQMCEFYPNLFDKICKREPNAYMAMLYFDTEFFRHKKSDSKKEEEKIDYKKKLFEALKEEWRFTHATQKKTKKSIERLLVMYGPILNDYIYKQMYNAVIGGDPKMRTYRRIQMEIFRTISKGDKNGK